MLTTLRRGAHRVLEWLRPIIRPQAAPLCGLPSITPTELHGIWQSVEDRARVTFHLRDVLLKPDTYHLGVWIGRANLEAFDYVSSAALFTVEADSTQICGSQHFPGHYQCRFTEDVEITTPQDSAVFAA